MEKHLRPSFITSFLLLMHLGWISIAAQDAYVVNFSDVSKWAVVGGGTTWTSYNAKTYLDENWSFHSTATVRGTADESFNGSLYSFRDRGVFTVKNTLLVEGLIGFSFQMRDWMTNAGKQRNLKISKDGGDSWSNLTVINKEWFDEYQVYQEYVYFFEDGAQSFDAEMLVIILDGGDNNNDGRINIGEFRALKETNSVSIPVISPATSHVWQPFEAEITSATAGATIYYSLVGEDGPWTEYTEKINVTETTTIWAYAEKEDMDDSAVRTVTYTFPTEVANIAALRAGVQDGRLYKLTGEAIVTLKVANRNQIYIQDATGAILIDDANPKKLTSDYNVGDGIVGLIGSVGHFRQMIQIAPVTDAGGANSTGNVVEPAIVTISELGMGHDAQLVTVKGVSITRLTTGTGDDIVTIENFESAKNYVINDDSEGILRTAYSDLDYIGALIPTAKQDITGFVLRFDNDYQLVPRSLADIVTSSTVSVGDVTLADVVVYTDAVLNQLKVVGSKELAQVELVNTVGAVVKSVKVNSNNASVAMSELPKGVYIVRITSVDGSVTVSKVINR